MDETEQKTLIVRVLDKTIDFSITDGRLTVGALIRKLQQIFREEHLVALKIKELKIGKCVLDEKEPLVDVVLDGDEAVAVIEGKKDKKN